MCYSMFIFLQQDPLALRAAGVLICLGAVGRENRKKEETSGRPDGKLEREKEGESYFYLPESHPLDAGG